MSEANETFGHVRSLLQDPSLTRAQVWQEVVELLDTCEPDALDALTQYIQSYIDRGEREAKFGGLFESSPFDLDVFRFMGRAPRQWYAPLIDGEPSPKFTLIRELDLRSDEIASAKVSKMLEHPDLTHLRRLCLSYGKAPTGALFKRLCQQDSLSSMESLGISTLKSKAVDYIEAHGQAQRGLRTLDLSSFDVPTKEQPHTVEMLVRLCRTPYVSTIETLCLGPCGVSQEEVTTLLDEVITPEVLPELYHLHIAGYLYDPWAFIVDVVLSNRSVQERIRGLSCSVSWGSTPASGVDAFLAFCAMDYPGRLARLDLSSMRPNMPGVRYDNRFSHKASRHMYSVVHEHLPGAKILDRIDALYLGPWLTSELRDALTTAHPHLDVS